MQPAIHKGALLAGAIATALAITIAAPTRAIAHPHLKVQGRARKVAHRLTQKPPIEQTRLAITYTAEKSKQASREGSGFWLDGASLDGALTFHGGFGVAANLSVLHGGHFSNGGNIGKTTIAFGPRYTKDTTEWVRKGNWRKKEDWFKKAPHSQVYIEALFGVAHGFDGGFPERDTIASSANSSAVQLGAGVDVVLWRNFGARVFDLDYIHTGLPNGANNSQNDLRLSFGITYSLGNSVSPVPPAPPETKSQP